MRTAKSVALILAQIVDVVAMISVSIAIANFTTIYNNINPLISTHQLRKHLDLKQLPIADKMVKIANIRKICGYTYNNTVITELFGKIAPAHLKTPIRTLTVRHRC